MRRRGRPPSHFCATVVGTRASRRWTAQRAVRCEAGSRSAKWRSCPRLSNLGAWAASGGSSFPWFQRQRRNFHCFRRPDGFGRRRTQGGNFLGFTAGLPRLHLAPFPVTEKARCRRFGPKSCGSGAAGTPSQVRTSWVAAAVRASDIERADSGMGELRLGHIEATYVVANRWLLREMVVAVTWLAYASILQGKRVAFLVLQMSKAVVGGHAPIAPAEAQTGSALVRSAVRGGRQDGGNTPSSESAWNQLLFPTADVFVPSKSARVAGWQRVALASVPWEATRRRVGCETVREHASLEYVEEVYVEVKRGKAAGHPLRGVVQGCGAERADRAALPRRLPSHRAGGATTCPASRRKLHVRASVFLWTAPSHAWSTRHLSAQDFRLLKRSRVEEDQCVKCKCVES